MTAAGEWYEQEMSRRVARGVLVGGGVVGGLVASVAALADASPSIAVASGLVAAVGATVLRGVASVVGHPTGWPHHRRYLAHRPELVGIGWAASADAGRVAETIGDLEALGFAPVETLVDRRADEAVVLHVLTARDGVVTAAVAVPSGSTTLMTHLIDGRTLVSAAPGIPVCDELVVNPVRSARAVDVVASHARILKLMFETRLRAQDPVDLTVQTIAAERRAWAALGRMTAATTAVGLRRPRVRLAGSVPDEAVLLQSALAVTAPGLEPTEVVAARPLHRLVPAPSVAVGGGPVGPNYQGVGT